MGRVREGRLQELRDEISNLVNAIARGALRSSPALADRLAQAELKLAAEVENAVVDGDAGETRIPRSLEFYEQFITTISARFLENSRETRTMLSDLIGGAITLMAKERTRELDVCCPLGTTTFRRRDRSGALFVARYPTNGNDP